MCVRRVCAATSVAVAFIVCLGLGISGNALAGDDPDEPTVILFSGRDLWRNGVFAYGGFLTAPGGFEQDGLMLKMLLSGGAYRYTAQDLNTDVIGAEAVIQVLPGWRIKRGDIEAKFFFGLDIERHKLWPDDPGNRLRGTDIGARFAVELWYEPTPATMLAGDLSLSTIATNNSARIAYGWRVPEDVIGIGDFYVGPEAQYFASDGYRHWRLGAHVTGLKADGYEWSAAAGWASDSTSYASPYLRLGMSVRQ
ncbi:cellulose biosynthesis protein BcsS [Pseudolabrys taiwanensis]|uniref:Cellulose biosynthesis protein BcsS n=1 Tax=Pseudolabrys taiwanensis TaxID=331696 RepID=A0A345ZUL2_9HYPH|nr:cellulose biosynthesis protein BcsS [Pseudolabrys taiwanensis]AXK80609.1 cellulose biosynthesis protein BcsS [Pseudolabrys taiwanensis]